MDYPPENAPLQRAAYPDIRPLALGVPPAEALLKARDLASTLGWRIIAVDVAEGYMEATVSTPLLRFKDDVVVEVHPAAGGSEVHMRSKSRLGKGDFGANAQRIRVFLGRLAR
jgi:uncharacterized protein (DUF1499 family)